MSNSWGIERVDEKLGDVGQQEAEVIIGLVVATGTLRDEGYTTDDEEAILGAYLIPKGWCRWCQEGFSCYGHQAVVLRRNSVCWTLRQ